MKLKTLGIILAVIYALAFVVTFGHAHNTIPARQGIIAAAAAPDRVLSALISSAFWPLYWSSECFKHLRA